MKKFVRFLITILVFVIVGGTIYFCINENKEKLEAQPPINYQPDEVETNNEEILQNKLEQTLKEIDVIMEKTMENQENIETRIVFQKGVLGTEADEYIDFFGIDGISASVYTTNSLEGVIITVVPDIDFMKTQEFLYNKNGNLILYNSISNTVEGVVHYYFSDGILLKAIEHYEEEIDVVFENEADILLKASNIYKMFVK